MSKPQLFEAGHIKGRMSIVLEPTGLEVTSAGAEGSFAGQTLTGEAVAKAVAPTLRRAEKLLAVINAASAKERELAEKLTALERERKAVPNLLFGDALTTRLDDLNKQVSAIRALIISAGQEQEHAQAELRSLRDALLRDTPKAVGRAVKGRLAAAGAERAKAADALAAVAAEHLAHVLRLDGELFHLDGVKPAEVVKAALEEALPAVFAAGGLAPCTVYDWRDEPAPSGPVERKGWRRPGHEEEYGITDDRWED
jgi:hypothetical protein